MSEIKTLTDEELAALKNKESEVSHGEGKENPMEENQGKEKTLAQQAAELRKKNKVKAIYYCGGYWFFDIKAAEKYAVEIKQEVTDYSKE